MILPSPPKPPPKLLRQWVVERDATESIITAHTLECRDNSVLVFKTDGIVVRVIKYWCECHLITERDEPINEIKEKQS